MMKTQPIILTLLVCWLTACAQTNKNQASDNSSAKQQVLQVMQRHLDAVSQKDLDSLAATLPPDGNMQLILPATEIIATAAGFLKFHADWFKQPDWTFETEILNAKVGTELAMVVVQIIYREPIRDGKPYFNRMIVSYDLAHIDDQWYVIKDHASSVEKSTDQ